MSAKEFYDLVVKMRKAQKEYFRTRLSSFLKESKELERQVDNEIERVEELIHPKPIQQKLF